MSRFLGIDVGGTKIAAAVVNATTGELDAEEVVPTPCGAGVDILAACVALAERAADRTSFEAIGIGLCEAVGRDGEIRSAVSVDWIGLDVPAAFAHVAPAIVESDVRAAAVAEAGLGAGRDHESFLYVNAGSGLSSCLVIGGRPLVGATGNAILIGGGPMYVEEISSGRAIAARCGLPTGRDVGAAAATDEFAQAVLRQAGAALGAATAFAVNLVDPSAVVIGGSVGLEAPFVWEELERAMRLHIWSEESRTVPLLPAELGARAGVVGAALSASTVATLGLA
jgi:glucokinase